MSAFEDPSIKSAVGELEAAEAFFSNDDNAFDDPPVQTRPKQSLSGGFGSELPRSDGVPPVAFTSGTLDETVGETLWRDASHVGGNYYWCSCPTRQEAKPSSICGTGICGGLWWSR